MASGISLAVISGNLTKDPELNESGKILRVSVAVNQYRKDEGDVAHFFDCKILGEKRAQALYGLLTKGCKVTIQGDLVQERWEKDGQKRSAVLIIAREVVLGDAPRNASAPEASSQGEEEGPGW